MISKFNMTPRYFWIAMFLAAFGLVACSDSDGQLKPLLPESSRERIFAAEPQLVTFSDLQEHPEDYKDSLIRVSGSYFRLEAPNCFPHSGYGAEWMLVSEDLRLDAVGFEQLMRLIAEGTLLTVDGFFRLYEGPFGCGKAAPATTAWFLEVMQIVQPNPLVKRGDTPAVIGTSVEGPPLATIPGTETALPPVQSPTTQPPTIQTPQLTMVPTGTPTTIGTVPPIGTGTVAPTGTRPGTGTPTITPTNQSTGTTTVTPTQTVTGTPSPSVTPIATSTSGPAPTQPPLPTTYPGPTPIPTGYPS